MMNKTRILVIIIATTVVFVGTQASKRNTLSFDMSVTSYQKPRLRNYYSEQPFIDKMVEQRTLPDIPIRSRNIRQQLLRDQSFADQAIYSPSFPRSRHRSFKQNFIHRIPSFDDQSLLKDTSLRNQELHDGRAIFRDNPLEGTLQDTPFSSDEFFKAQELMYRNQGPFKEQLSIVETPLKKLLRGQLSSGEQASSFPKETAFVEYPSFPNPMKPYRDESYNKPIDSYGRQKDGNQALGISSISMVSSRNHHLPFNAEISTTTPSILTTTHEPDSRISSASAIMTKVNPSEAFKTKFGRTSMLDGSFNMLVDGSSKMFSDTFPTMPSISVSANQSSVVGHILTSLTTESSLPVMATKTPIALFIENALAPIYFQSTKHGTVMTPSFPIQSELKNNVHALSYLLAQVPRSSFTMGEYNLKYLMPEGSKKNMKTDIQTPVLNYILPEGYKSESKNNIQNSFANCAQPPEGFKHSWPLQQQFSQPDTLSSYAPLPLNGNVKLILPSIQVAPLSPVSWPIEMKHEIPIKLPTKSLLESDPSTTSSNLPLDISLPLNFMTNIPNSLTSSIPNTITGSISNSITTNIPGSLTADMSASIPALNLGQHLHHMEQLRQIQDARNSWYPTGI